MHLSFLKALPSTATPATVFNPMALGVGTHTVVYTVNGGGPKATGPTDPGCIQPVTKVVQVLATPSTLTCRGLVNVSLDATCMAVVNPETVLQGTYGCYDDYAVTLSLPNGTVIPNATLTAAHIGTQITASVRHLVSGVSCWGYIHVEDKLAPVITGSNITVSCGQENITPAALSNIGIANATPAVQDCSPVDSYL